MANVGVPTSSWFVDVRHQRGRHRRPRLMFNTTHQPGLVPPRASPSSVASRRSPGLDGRPDRHGVGRACEAAVIVMAIYELMPGSDPPGAVLHSPPRPVRRRRQAETGRLGQYRHTPGGAEDTMMLRGPPPSVQRPNGADLSHDEGGQDPGVPRGITGVVDASPRAIPGPECRYRSGQRSFTATNILRPRPSQ